MVSSISACLARIILHRCRIVHNAWDGGEDECSEQRAVNVATCPKHPDDGRDRGRKPPPRHTLRQWIESPFQFFSLRYQT